MTRRKFIKISIGAGVPLWFAKALWASWYYAGGDSGCSGYKGVALSVGASNGTSSYANSTKYTHSGGNCDVNRMAIYCRLTGMVAANVKLAIYSDSSGPNAPLAYTGAIAVASDDWTADAALSETVSLVDSTVYWLAFIGDDVFSYKYDTGSAGDSHYDTDVAYGSFPANPFGSDGTLDRFISIRMSYV